MVKIKVKRVYDEYNLEDGYRILVDRLWPRGLSKEKAKIDLWFKEIAPSDKLRKWFNHEQSKWEEFKKKYFEELNNKKDVVNKLLKIIQEKKNVTFLFSAKDRKYNNAIALKEYYENCY